MLLHCDNRILEYHFLIIIYVNIPFIIKKGVTTHQLRSADLSHTFVWSYSRMYRANKLGKKTKHNIQIYTKVNIYIQIL